MKTLTLAAAVLLVTLPSSSQTLSAPVRPMPADSNQVVGTGYLAQEDFLKHPNGLLGGFGTALAMTDDTLVVNGAGGLLVYALVGSTWTYQTNLLPVGLGAKDEFGLSIAIQGDTLVAGAYYSGSSPSANSAGAAYVFKRTGSNWSFEQKLVASNGEQFDKFGQAVAIDGDTIVVGAPDEASIATGINGDELDNSAFRSGAAYVFSRLGSTWTQEAYLKASNTDAADVFGSSVCVQGNRVVVGAPQEDSQANGINGGQGSDSATGAGAAYVFMRDATSTWSQEAYVKASNSSEFDYFGFFLAFSGDTLAIGAAGESGGGRGVGGDPTATPALQNSGAVYIFTHAQSTWSQQEYIKASNASSLDLFGRVLALSGDTLVVSTRYEDSNAIGVGRFQGDNTMSDAGAAYRFVRTGQSWTQADYIKPSNTGANDFFGSAVGVSASNVIVGAPGEDSQTSPEENTAFNSGAVYVFQLGQTPLATVAFRTGGTNRQNYIASTPVLGGTWTANTSLIPTSHKFAQIFGFLAPTSLTLRGGQLSLIAGPELFRLPAILSPTPSWTVQLPSDPSLATITVYTQAIYFGRVTPFVLTNSQDLVLGF